MNFNMSSRLITTACPLNVTDCCWPFLAAFMKNIPKNQNNEDSRLRKIDPGM